LKDEDPHAQKKSRIARPRSAAPLQSSSTADRAASARRRLVIDYKDVGTLERLCSQQGKLFSRKRSGNCAKHQRQLKNAVKQAYYVGLLPFVG
jgi:small subunit ribosomal protein S18